MKNFPNCSIILSVHSINDSENTGGYANDYILGDGKSKEIGLLEIATFNHVLIKKNNGFIPSSNFVQFPEVRKESNIVYDQMPRT